MPPGFCSGPVPVLPDPGAKQQPPGRRMGSDQPLQHGDALRHFQGCVWSYTRASKSPFRTLLCPLIPSCWYPGHLRHFSFEKLKPRLMKAWVTMAMKPCAFCSLVIMVWGGDWVVVCGWGGVQLLHWSHIIKELWSEAFSGCRLYLWQGCAVGITYQAVCLFPSIPAGWLG